MTQTTVNALLIPADETQRARVAPVGTDLSSLRSAIGGGWLEAVTGQDWHAYFDEEGKIKALAPNNRATALLRVLGWRNPDTLVGDVVFVGSGEADEEDGDANEGDVPQHVLETMRDLAGEDL